MENNIAFFQSKPGPILFKEYRASTNDYFKKNSSSDFFFLFINSLPSKFPEPKLMELYVLFCLINPPKPKDVQFIIMLGQGEAAIYQI